MYLMNAATSFDWSKDYPHVVTVCDTDGIIIAMNTISVEAFKKRGAADLIGTSLFDCHPEPANVIIGRLLASRSANTYIVEKGGRKKLVHQTPWYKNEQFAGLVETVTELPAELPVIKRD